MHSRHSYKDVAFFLCSWLIVSFGQAAWISLLGPFAAIFGLALFWKVAIRAKRPFLLAFVYFTAVQAVQISWMSESEYMGPLIWVVYLMLSAAIGLEFALLTRLVIKESPLTLLGCAGLAGGWVFLEWIRILPCTGFLWNPAGLALSASLLSLQAASLFGIYGLSFWVIFVNLSAVRAFALQTKRAFAFWIAASLFPFAFGAIHQMSGSREGETLSALLIQPNLFPNERDLFPEQSEKWVPPLDQWAQILDLIEKGASKQIDLIVLPEVAVPFPVFKPIYPLEHVEHVWTERFGVGAARKDFPRLSKKTVVIIQGKPYVSNAFWVQSIANRFQSEVIAGMEDDEGEKRFNAAFYFKPNKESADRYEKRILVPVGEYVPLRAYKAIAEWIDGQFGICDSFDAGTEPKLFLGKVPMGISICMEETYGEIIRSSCKMGAHLLVNVTNDGWFPRSRLIHQHFNHGRIRAVENGVPLLRACCTGVTGGVDCYGHTLALSPIDEPDALFVEVPLQRVATTYSIWGDFGIFLLSALFLFALLFQKWASRKTG